MLKVDIKLLNEQIEHLDEMSEWDSGDELLNGIINMLSDIAVQLTENKEILLKEKN